MSGIDRLDALRGRLDAAGVASLVVSARPNVRYLSGFSGSAGLLVVRAGDAVLVTDGRYAEQAPREVGAGVAVEIAPGAQEGRDLVAALVRDAGPVGFEAEHVTWAEADRWAAALSPR